MHLFIQLVSKIDYHRASNNTLVVKKLSYEKLQPITNNEKKGKLSLITILK